jgi:hypothetical protein
MTGSSGKDESRVPVLTIRDKSVTSAKEIAAKLRVKGRLELVNDLIRIQPQIHANILLTV